MQAETIANYLFENSKNQLEIEIVSLERILEHNTQEGFLPHRIDFYELLVFTEGNGTHSVDFEQLNYQANTIIPVAPGQVQQYLPNSSAKGFAVVFKTDFLVHEESDYHFLFDYTLFNHSLSPITHTYTPEMAHIVQQMQQEQDRPHLFESSLYQRNLLKNLLILVERNKRQHTQINCNDSLRLYLAFRKIIESNLHYKLRVSDIAEELHSTSKKINIAVKTQTHQTAKQYINNRIILEIKRLLSYSPLNIKEIAFQLGFDDPTNFTKFFKTRVGTHPTHYRENRNR